MVRGLDTFREYFRGFENQYVLIGGAACDILFANNEGQFRATSAENHSSTDLINQKKKHIRR